MLDGRLQRCRQVEFAVAGGLQEVGLLGKVDFNPRR